MSELKGKDLGQSQHSKSISKGDRNTPYSPLCPRVRQRATDWRGLKLIEESRRERRSNATSLRQDFVRRCKVSLPTPGAPSSGDRIMTRALRLRSRTRLSFRTLVWPLLRRLWLLRTIRHRGIRYRRSRSGIFVIFRRRSWRQLFLNGLAREHLVTLRCHVNK
jgi:hypothetical protein